MTPTDRTPARETRGELAWRIYRIENLLFYAERTVDSGMRVLRRAHDKKPEDVFRVRPQRVVDLREAVEELGELVDQAQGLIEALPAGEIRVTCEGAAVEALRELREGEIYDAKRVLLVGQITKRRDGLMALAEGLRNSDAYESWIGLTLKALFVAFDRMTPQLIRLLVTDVGLTPGDLIAHCTLDEVNRLAGRVDEYVGRGK